MRTPEPACVRAPATASSITGPPRPPPRSWRDAGTSTLLRLGAVDRLAREYAAGVCVVELLGDGRLGGTVVGVGDGPLPLI